MELQMRDTWFIDLRDRGPDPDPDPDPDPPLLVEFTIPTQKEKTDPNDGRIGMRQS